MVVTNLQLETNNLLVAFNGSFSRSFRRYASQLFLLFMASQFYKVICLQLIVLSFSV